MKKSLYLLAIAAMMVACSQNELVELNPDNAISFKATTNNNTKAVEVYSSTVLPSAFDVIGIKGTNVYMPKTTVSKNGSDWTYTPTYYWPNDDSEIAFTGFAPSGLTGIAATGITDFEVKANAAEQIDLLYAYNTGKKSVNEAAPVVMNFRHALSQILFNTQVEDGASINVVVNSYTIGGIKGGKANYTVNGATTHQTLESDTYQNTGIGSWSTPDVAAASYNVTKAGTAQELILFPQQFSAWAKTSKIESTTVGGYIILECKVINNQDGSYILGSENQWGKTAFAISGTWEQGKKYTYMFNFTKNGGGGGVDPEDPTNPTFVPVDFTVTVDDFFPVDPINVKPNNEN